MLRFTFIWLFLSSLLSVNAQQWRRLQSLKGTWLFSIGDNKEWSSANFKDGSWEKIKVPSSWEDQGFNGYNGYAWYRKHFKIDKGIMGKAIYLRLGRVDDVDEVYINGFLIGTSGNFPPDYESSYYAWREYYIPQNYLNYDKENIIAVRVYDAELEGGILEGEVALFEDRSTIILDYDLTGEWKFNTGDNLEWKESNFDDKDWEKMLVPGNWELLGYKDYDGFGWYRKTFNFPTELAKEKLVLYLGKIDDYDMVYLNGKLIGSTGNISNGEADFELDKFYQQSRGYYIPAGLLKPNGNNTIAVRVYDGFKDGGIYKGPVGLITQSKYKNYWRSVSSKQKKSLWDLIFN